jgi:sterol desaturase/sphingolipid hydroxylase (fatty acid hydroxylase superfamily)
MAFSAIQQIIFKYPAAIQIAFYASYLGALWILEYRLTDQALSAKAKHSAFNASLLLMALPAQILMTSLVLVVSRYCTHSHIGLLSLLPYRDTPLVKYGLMFLVMDFLDYAYHYAAHHVPWLWRLHLVHHSDRDVDVSTTFREHPLETLVRTSVLCAWVALCGAPVELLVLRQTFETIANVGQHSSVALPPRLARLMRAVFVTPDMHQAHHHAYRPGTDCNYGDVLSFWDRLFGTKVTLSPNDIQFGVDTHLDRDRDMRGLLTLKPSVANPPL